MSRYTRTVLSLMVADALLVLFLTFGSVFPSRLAIPHVWGDAMPDEFYDFTAKASPFEVPNTTQKRSKTKVPVISARSLPVLSSLRVEPVRAKYTNGDSQFAVQASAAFGGD